MTQFALLSPQKKKRWLTFVIPGQQNEALSYENKTEGKK